MNMSWKIIKVVGAFLVIAGLIFWLINTISSQSYTGTELNFEVGNGSIIVTNPTGESVPLQFASTGTRSFRVSSDIEGVSGNSIREGSGLTTTQHFDLELPTGTSEFTITRGTQVMLTASASGELEAIVSPQTDDLARTITFIVIGLVLALLFYASNVMKHSWIRMLRGKNSNSQDTEPTPVVATSAQGRAAKSFGDNRAETGD